MVVPRYALAVDKVSENDDAFVLRDIQSPYESFLNVADNRLSGDDGSSGICVLGVSN